MQYITKNTFLQSQHCLTKGCYLYTNEIQTPLTQAELFRMNEGIEIGKMARSLYPNGALVNEGGNIRNAEKTQQLMADKNIRVIFEATFIHGAYIARADILIREDNEWHLIEVKSSAYSDDKELDDKIDDLIYTAMVISRCEIKLSKMSLLLVSKNYRPGMDNSHFFIDVDCSEQVNQRLFSFISSADIIANAFNMEHKPEPKLILHCKKCEFFKTQCIGKNIENPVFDLPRITNSTKKFNALAEENIHCIESIPQAFTLTDTQEITRMAVINKEPLINKEILNTLLDEIIFPAYYLDFETVSTAIPLYNDIAPYQEIVTQYSIHKISGTDGDEAHYEFLADHTKDDRKALAEKLITDIGNSGSVIVYHAAAEKKYIKNLANAVPELADELLTIIDRIVDLEVIINKSYYHPAFHGSYSIKVVLPVLVPEMSYKNLVIGDGQSANIIFAELARGKYSTTESGVLRKELLTYCKQDTLAMVEIHKKLADLAYDTVSV